jgi:hypothetical protein
MIELSTNEESAAVACVAGPQFYGGPDLQRDWRPATQASAAVKSNTFFLQSIVALGADH